jgi:hypothetical protein
MEYFARLEMSMDETSVCLLDPGGVETRRASTAEAIAGELSKSPSCSRVAFFLRHTVYVGLTENRAATSVRREVARAR